MQTLWTFIRLNWKLSREKFKCPSLRTRRCAVSFKTREAFKSRKCYLRSRCFIFGDARPRRDGLMGMWPIVVPCGVSAFTVLHRDLKGRVCPARNHQEGPQRTADPIRVREGGGLNGPRSRIPPLIKALSLIIVLDRQMASRGDLLSQRAFRAVVILFRCTSSAMID